jgi:RNA polymerase sigma-70 factor (ECF subfamily)
MLIALKTWLHKVSPSRDPLEAYQQTGEDIYIEILINTYSQDLFHFLKGQSDGVLAQDICQKTWLTVVEKRHLYRNQQTPKAWLFSIARNALLDEFKKQNRLCALDEQYSDAVAQDTLENENGDLYQAILTLPFLQREALSLQLEGFSLQEIATITNSESETIKTRLRYAKQTLKQRLGDKHGE